MRTTRYDIQLRKSVNLTWALTVREFKGQYRRSSLGPVWAVLQPLFYMVIFSILRGTFKVYTSDVPYVLFTFSAMVPWSFFSNAVLRCSSSVTSNAGIIKKIYTVKEIFPASKVICSLIDFLISLLILLILMVWFKVQFTINFLWVPVLLLILLVLTMGVGMGVAAIGTFKQDVVFALPVLLQFWMFATPIIYPLDGVHDRWRLLFFLNPLTGIIDGFRKVSIIGTAPELSQIGLSVLGTLLILSLTWPLYRYMSQFFADVL